MQLSKVTLRAARELGIKPLFYLGVYRLLLKIGWIRRRTPPFKWESMHLGSWVKVGIPHSPEAYVIHREGLTLPFFFDKRSPVLDQIKKFHEKDMDAALSTAEGILEGTFPLFGSEEYKLGFPPSWNSDPSMKSNSLEANLHWTEYEIERISGDVRLIWEPSRFAWAFVLARAYLLSEEVKFADGFWELLQSWRMENEPNKGPQWISAQEVAIRLLSLVFCFYAFFEELKTQPDHLAVLAETIAVHAARIPPTLAYSQAQRNNHLLLEAVALHTVGILFPEFRSAERWKEQGRRLFISGVNDQFFPDGGYIQHSTNYQRLALEASLWMVRLAQLHGEEFPKEVVAKLHRSVQLLRALVDGRTGCAANVGHNDGAYLFPLTNCSFDDYRPTLQLASHIFDQSFINDSGSWEELPFWFGFSSKGEIPAQSTEEEYRHENNLMDHGVETGKIFPQAGFYILQGVESSGFLRCVDFTNRPGHSDQLNFDLWWKGVNIIKDAGTYLYNGEDPWKNALAYANVHNAPFVDEREPMDRQGSFLWLNWSRGRIVDRKTSVTGLIEAIVAAQDGYRELEVTITRTVLRAGDQIWILVDDLFGRGHHSLTTGWLIPDVDYTVEEGMFHLNTDPFSFRIGIAGENCSLALYRGGEKLWGDFSPKHPSVLGWHSPTYARKEPALHLLANLNGADSLRLVTTFVLGDANPHDVKLQLADPGEHPGRLPSLSYLGEHLKS